MAGRCGYHVLRPWGRLPSSFQKAATIAPLPKLDLFLYLTALTKTCTWPLSSSPFQHQRSLFPFKSVSSPSSPQWQENLWPSSQNPQLPKKVPWFMANNSSVSGRIQFHLTKNLDPGQQNSMRSCLIMWNFGEVCGHEKLRRSAQRINKTSLWAYFLWFLGQKNVLLSPLIFQQKNKNIHP